MIFHRGCSSTYHLNVCPLPDLVTYRLDLHHRWFLVSTRQITSDLLITPQGYWTVDSGTAMETNQLLRTESLRSSHRFPVPNVAGPSQSIGDQSDILPALKERGSRLRPRHRSQLLIGRSCR